MKEMRSLIVQAGPYCGSFLVLLDEEKIYESMKPARARSIISIIEFSYVAGWYLFHRTVCSKVRYLNFNTVYI